MLIQLSIKTGNRMSFKSAFFNQFNVSIVTKSHLAQIHLAPRVASVFLRVFWYRKPNCSTNLTGMLTKTNDYD